MKYVIEVDLNDEQNQPASVAKRVVELVQGLKHMDMMFPDMPIDMRWLVKDDVASGVIGELKAEDSDKIYARAFVTEDEFVSESFIPEASRIDLDDAEEFVKNHRATTEMQSDEPRPS